MEIERLWLYAAMGLSLAGYGIYWYGLRKQLIRPNRFSWLIWSAVTTVEALTYQAVNEGLLQNIVFFTSAASCLFITFAIWREGAWQRPSNTEMVSMAIALASLILWIGFNASYWAHVLVVVAVPISFLPTLLSALEDRRKEMSPSWGLWTLGDAATLALILSSPGKGELDLPYIIIELVCHGAIWAVIGFRSINPLSLLPSHSHGRQGGSSGDLPSGSSFRVGSGEFGLAVFANRAFPTGAYLIEFCGPRYHRSEVLSNLPGSDDRFVQIDQEHFMGPSGGMDDLVNHSCEPNAGLRFDEHGIFLVAIRPIQSGEEICWDYSTTSSRSTFFMKCKCGAETCRQVIGDFEFLEPELQAHYRELGLLPPFLQDAVLSRPRTLAA